MEEVIKDPGEEGIKSGLRAGTKCLWVNKDNNIATVNLSKEFYNNDNVADILALGVIYRSIS